MAEPELTSALAGRYSVERELGRGGMGAVYLARDLTLDRLVAIKVLPPELAVRPELRERFLRETRTAASFSHPNIVPVHAVEQGAGLLFFVMGYVEGETLTQRIRRQGPLGANDAVRLLQEVAWALSYAHGRGVVHRDVKPDNILLERATGRALVTDFGIARSVAASALTQVGETVGTPQFMSPEQAAGDSIDSRSDLYSLGVVAYFAVTGQLPFDGESAQAIMAKQISQPALPVGGLRADLPAALSAAIDRCLAKDPAQRFATGEALVEALESLRSQQPEVTPAIRLFVVKADQFLRSAFILAVLTPQLSRAFKSDFDVLLYFTLLLSAVLGLLAQVPVGLRQLAFQGFGFEAIRAGIQAIDVEQIATLGALKALPEARARRRRTIRRLTLSGLVSVALIVFAFSQRHEIAEHTYGVSRLGAAAIFPGVMLGMFTLVFTMASLGGPARAQRRFHRLYTGPVGRWLYRMATRRMPPQTGAGSAVAGAATSYQGARTVLDQLPPALRKKLGRVEVDLERLEGAVERLTRREKELDGSIAEVRLGAPSGAGSVAGSKQEAFMAELEAARRVAIERRVSILGALETLRLAILRLKSGLGRPEDVSAELATARQLIDESS